jgi:glycosyltransferase involved in cell wall biosynthesis
VIHYHNVSLLGPEIFRLGDGTAALKLYTAHEHWLVCPTHALWKFNRRVCEKPDCVRCSIISRRPPQLWRFTGMMEQCSKEVDAFLAPTRFTAEIHQRRGFAAPMLQFPIFAPRADSDWQEPAPRRHERAYFLFVGRMETIKGVDGLIQAWSRVKQADLLLAGSGSREQELRKLASSNPRIKFLGETPSTALGALYAHCLACIIPSLVYETFSTVILEAFARKAPVIARNLGSLAEIVAESEGGLLFSNESELLEAVARIGSPDVRARA